MGGHLRDIRGCLFQAFANPAYCDPQERQYMWAIIEGMRRIDPSLRTWKAVQARKDHECVRGCHIQRHTTYFKHRVGGGWGSDWKFCAGCMALILYFKEVDQLPPYKDTHWDQASGKPVRCWEEPDAQR